VNSNSFLAVRSGVGRENSTFENSLNLKTDSPGF
jgi:hypothetical protein